MLALKKVPSPNISKREINLVANMSLTHRDCGSHIAQWIKVGLFPGDHTPLGRPHCTGCGRWVGKKLSYLFETELTRTLTRKSTTSPSGRERTFIWNSPKDKKKVEESGLIPPMPMREELVVTFSPNADPSLPAPPMDYRKTCDCPSCSRYRALLEAWQATRPPESPRVLLDRDPLAWYISKDDWSVKLERVHFTEYEAVTVLASLQKTNTDQPLELESITRNAIRSCRPGAPTKALVFLGPFYESEGNGYPAPPDVANDEPAAEPTSVTESFAGDWIIRRGLWNVLVKKRYISEEGMTKLFMTVREMPPEAGFHWLNETVKKVAQGTMGVHATSKGIEFMDIGYL